MAHLPRSLTLVLMLLFSFLPGCSMVGPGLANHPGDCALGIPWADCLPGTAGYNNGGGRIHREAAAQEQLQRVQADVAQEKAAQDQCLDDYRNTSLDPIRQKVELFRHSAAAPVPFLIASNSAFPSAEEREAIASWATIRDECVRRADAAYVAPRGSPLEMTHFQIDRKFTTDANASVGMLIVALFQGKMTFGEFAQKRYEIGQSMSGSKLQFREATLATDQQRRMQLEELAQKRMQTELQAWSTYVESVNARRPVVIQASPAPVSINCLSQKIGTSVMTNCN